MLCDCDISTTIWHHIIDWLDFQGQRREYITYTQIHLKDKEVGPSNKYNFHFAKIFISLILRDKKTKS